MYPFTKVKSEPTDCILQNRSDIDAYCRTAVTVCRPAKKIREGLVGKAVVPPERPMAINWLVSAGSWETTVKYWNVSPTLRPGLPKKARACQVPLDADTVAGSVCGCRRSNRLRTTTKMVSPGRRLTNVPITVSICRTVPPTGLVMVAG